MKKMRQERVKSGKVLKINSIITQIDPKNLPVLERAISDFKEAQSSNTSSLLNRQETLFNNIRNMTDDSKSNALDLFDNMKYPKGRNQGKIISPHIQKKAIDFLNYGLYKKKSTIKDLEEENKELKTQIKKFGKEKEKLIKKTQSLGASKQHFKTKSEKRVSTIRSLVHKSGNFSENEFKNQVKSLFKINKNEYSPQMVWLATRITQVGQVSMRSTVECLQLVYQFLIGEKPKKWLSRSTLSTWHQEVANLEVHSTITQLSEVNSYGIMVDESTRGENKYLVIVFAFWSYVENFPLAKVIELKVISKCDSVTIATNVLNLIEEKKLDPKACSVWITDNTAYMSGKHNGAVLKYNRMSSSNAVRIGCGLHIIHIVLTNFEQAAFGKRKNTIGFSRVAHPFNLLYLTWSLHDGYDSSDKDKPMNITSEKIRKLYDSLLGYHFTQYQLPLQSRWGYELQTAKQYLERCETHIEFANWFISKMENCPKSPSSYLNDWKLFLSWLTSTNLNVQIRCLVRLGEIFYEPLMQFMIGQDPHPRIYTESGFKNLPNGRRAHEMPDKVTEWLSFLRDLKENFDIVFGQELLEALQSLDSDEWGSLYDSLERGIIKALEHFESWMLPWLHLPLSICRLGGDNGQAFARSYYYVFFSKSWVNEPSQIEINYAEQLQNDVENFFTDDFGLQNCLTQNQEFKKEFEEFCNTLDPTLSNFQLLYSFVKEKIYCIIIHQQQVEGLFNKLDLKTHDNMSINTKKAKIQLTNGPIDKINIENNLNEIRAQQQKRQKLNVLQENIQQHYGQNYANSLYSNLFQN